MMKVRAGAEAEEGMEDRGFLALSPRLVQYLQPRTAFRVQEVGRGVVEPPLRAGLSHVNLTQENALSPWSPG